MDDIDIAQANDEMFRRQALAAHFRKNYGDTIPNSTNSSHVPTILCIDCGEEIEPARLDAKPDARRCIDCQEIHERRF